MQKLIDDIRTLCQHSLYCHSQLSSSLSLPSVDSPRSPFQNSWSKTTVMIHQKYTCNWYIPHLTMIRREASTNYNNELATAASLWWHDDCTWNAKALLDRTHAPMHAKGCGPWWTRGSRLIQYRLQSAVWSLRCNRWQHCIAAASRLRHKGRPLCSNCSTPCTRSYRPPHAQSWDIYVTDSTVRARSTALIHPSISYRKPAVNTCPTDGDPQSSFRAAVSS